MREPSYEAMQKARAIDAAQDRAGLKDADRHLTVRDWFAGQALAGFIACPTTKGEMSDFANAAYATADAMLVARSRDKP